MILGCVLEGIFLMSLAGLFLVSPDTGDAVLDQVRSFNIPLTNLPSMKPELGQLLCFNLFYLGIFYLVFGLQSNVGFARFTVFSRLTIVPTILFVLAYLGRVRYDALFIAVPDALFAIWTHVELARSRPKFPID